MSERRRVVFFGGYRAKIFEWKGKDLIGVLDFEPSDEGYMMFFEYIARSTKTPTALLLDLIEEDFQKCSIPKVNSRDKKGVIDRLMDKYYRGNKYCHYELQGASANDSRKLDVILSSMINPDVFAPWFNIMKESGVALYGIFSVPYLTKTVLKAVDAKGENILLISRQVRSAVRESFYKHGRLQFSRFVKLASEQRLTNTSESTHQIVAQGTEHVQHFLRNQRIISFTDIIDIYALVPEDQIHNLPELTQIDTRRIHYISLDEIYKKKHLKHCEGQHADALFSYVCSTQSVFTNQYALQDELKELWLQTWRNIALVTSSIASVFLLSLSGIFITDTLNSTKEIKSFQESRAKLEQAYDQVYSPIERQISDAQAIKKAVEMADYLVSESKLNLQNAFLDVGSVLGKKDYQNLHVVKLEWEKLTQTDFDSLMDSSTVSIKLPEGELFFEEVYDDGYEENPLISLVPTLRLGGVADRSNMSYAETIVRIEEFIKELKARDAVEDVVAVKLPVDAREASRFQDQAGRGLISKQEQINENVFEFVIVFRGQKKSAWYAYE